MVALVCEHLKIPLNRNVADRNLKAALLPVRYVISTDKLLHSRIGCLDDNVAVHVCDAIPDQREKSLPPARRKSSHVRRIRRPGLLDYVEPVLVRLNTLIEDGMGLLQIILNRLNIGLMGC